MFNLLSVLIHIINSIFSGIYTSQFLKVNQNKKMTVIVWSMVYFVLQVVIFEIIHAGYSFQNVTGIIINIVVFVGMQRLFL